MPGFFKGEDDALDFLHNALAIADKQDKAVDNAQLPAIGGSVGSEVTPPPVPAYPSRRAPSEAPAGVPAGLRGPPPDRELADLQAFAERRRSAARLAKLGDDFASSFISPANRQPNDFSKSWGEEGDRAVEELKARREEAKKAKEESSAAKLEDSASPESIHLVEMAINLHPNLAKFLKPGQSPGKQALQILPFLPTLIKEQGDTTRTEITLGAHRELAEAKAKADAAAAAAKQGSDADQARLDRENKIQAVKIAAGTKGDKAISDLRKEFSGLPEVKAYKEVSVSYDKVKRAAQTPSAAGDLSLIFAYMKMLDPGSSVREGEFANAQNATGLPGKVVAAYNNALNGQRLASDQRADFIAQAKNLYASHEAQFKSVSKRYETFANKLGGEAGDVTFEPSFSEASGPAPDSNIRIIGNKSYRRNPDGKWMVEE